jgi:hypothetical protein
MESADFRFLVISKIGHDNWEAYTNNYWWDCKVVNDCIIRPHAGQEIRVTPPEYVSHKLRERFDKRQKAWDRISDQFQDYMDWHLKEEEQEEAKGWLLNEAAEEVDSSIVVADSQGQ